MGAAMSVSATTNTDQLKVVGNTVLVASNPSFTA
jgi:hypothetical protein